MITFAGLAHLGARRAALSHLLCWLCLVINAVAGPPPVITVQPTNQTVQVGGDATFVVQATSGTTLTYQWYFQGNLIPGAIGSSYMRAAVQPADAGSYYVAVSNADGTVNSANANLTVVSLVVTNTNNSGEGSLRQAITDANVAAGTNTITFNIAGAGPHVINVLSALPIITDPVILDASSQPGFAEAPVVRIDGASAGDGVDGLSLSSASDGSEIRGFMVTRFRHDGIVIQSGADNTTVAGNWLGTDGSGATNMGNGNDGIEIFGANAMIGGTNAYDRNVINHNRNEGINIAGSGATGNLILGNIIGLEPDGTSGSGNADVGIAILPGASGNTIGGTNAAARNLISRNYEGIEINTANNVVQGNYIGTDLTGMLNRGNRSDDGVEIQGSGTGNLIGGSVAGAGNLIAYNARNGVTIASGASNPVVGNHIYSNNLLGINLGQAGVSANDVGDADAGANNLQNFPVLTRALSFGSSVTITGSLNSTANSHFRVEIFASNTADGTGYGEGQRYLGFTELTTAGNGDASFSVTLPEAVAAGDFISVTATKCNSTFTTFTDTSEFTRNVTAQSAYDVATTKSGPTSVLATSNFTYTITVTNLGYFTATNVVVSDILPAGLDVVDVSGGGTVVGGGPGQVVFDSASSNNVSGNLNWTHVTTTAENRLMLVGVSVHNDVTVSNITYGGLDLSRAQTAPGSTVASEVWQLSNPPSGANTISITCGGTGTLIAGAATFSGVDQTTPLSGINTAQSTGKIASVTIGSATNEIVFDNVIAARNQPPFARGNQTLLWRSFDSASGGGASINPGTNSVMMSWGLTGSEEWAQVAASVKPAGLTGAVNWTIPRLASGAKTNLTITVTAPLGGTLTNSVASTAEMIDADPANNDGSADNARVVTTVQPVADLVVTQTGLTSVPPLTNFTYTVTVSNQGPSTASNVVVTDTLSPMLTFVGASGGGTYLGGVVTWPAVASLAKGATANFTVTVRAPLSGSVISTAASTSTSTDLNPANSDGGNPAAQVVTVVSPLQVANTSKGASVRTLNWNHTVSPGSSRILVVGFSVDDADTTIVAADFARFLPLTPIGQTNGAQSQVAMFYLLNPPVGSFPVSINLDTASGIVGGAVSFNGVNQTNPLTGFAANIGTGTNASLTLASTLGGVIVDTVAPKSPQHVTSLGAAQSLEWNLSDTNYSGAGSTMPGAPVASPFYTLDSAADWAMAAVALNPATVLGDITLTATGPANVIATSNLTYSITVTNLGSSSASNVVVSDALPAGMTFVSASGGGTNNAGVVTWPTLAKLGVGATANYTLTLRAPAFGTWTNLVYGTAFTADPDPSNNNGTGSGNQVVTTVAPLADVATTVTGPASVFGTADFSYTITLANAGPSPASDVVVIDPLPAGTTFVSASDGGTHDAGVVTWSLASLPSGAVTDLTVRVIAPANGSFTNTVASTAVTSDLVAANNDGSAPAAQVITTVMPLADVATTVTGPTSVVTNAPFTYLVSVANLGPSDAPRVVVNDTLPAGTTFVSASGGGAPSAGVVTWSLPSLAGGSVTNFTVTVIAPVLGSLTNTVASSAVSVDPDPANNDGSALTARVVTGVYPFLLLSGQQFSEGGFQVEFHTYPDTIVSILASTNLADWVTLITTNSGDGHVIFIDQDVAVYPQRFYRSRQ